MGQLTFVKGHGTGNDFVVLPDPDARLPLSPDLVRRLCDRRFGIGGDGVLRVVRTAALGLDPAATQGAEWFMDYHNADGSLAEMCGNGVRVYARFLVERGWAQPGRLLLATRGGVRTVDVPADTGGDIAVDMGAPQLGGESSARLAGQTLVGRTVSMGNPHLVCRVPDPAVLDLSTPPDVSPTDFPEGANVEFYAPRDGRLVMRVFERGSGETLSCGTGACAVAVAHAGATGSLQLGIDVPVDVPGGRLRVRWAGQTDGGCAPVWLTGPAVLVAEGSYLLADEPTPAVVGRIA